MCAALSCSVITDPATPWTVARQAPLPWGFSRPEYWSGLSGPPPEDLPNPGIEPMSPTLQVDSLPAEPPGKPLKLQIKIEQYRVPVYPLAGHMHRLLYINIPHLSGVLATNIETTLIHYVHPKSVIYIRVYSWCCAVYGFLHMYGDINLPLQYHTETIHDGFTALKILCALPVHLSLPSTLGDH